MATEWRLMPAPWSQARLSPGNRALPCLIQRGSRPQGGAALGDGSAIDEQDLAGDLSITRPDPRPQRECDQAEGDGPAGSWLQAQRSRAVAQADGIQ